MGAMFKFRLILVALCILALAMSVCAQQDGISIDTKATSSEIQKWLCSGDSRLVAWGAYFARENKDDTVIAPMVQLVERWTPPLLADPYSVRRAQTDAMSEVLDALIQRKQKVSPEILASIVTSFPRHAVILVSRLPLSEEKPLLLTWYAGRNSKEVAGSPRIAAMMLSKAPPSGFAASVISESEEELEVTVEDLLGIGHGQGDGSGGSCGDGIGMPSPKGWPPLFDYGLEENAPRKNDHVVVKAGGDRITYYRFSLSNNFGSCSYVRPLSAVTRHHLIAGMMGLSEKKMPWKVQQHQLIFWENQEQFTTELQGLVAAEETKYHTTAEAFYAKKVLTKAEADSVRPKLSITVSDYRKSAAIPLPQLVFNDPRTSLTYKTQ
jgi:hypothetical protein